MSMLRKAVIASSGKRSRFRFRPAGLDSHPGRRKAPQEESFQVPGMSLRHRPQYGQRLVEPAVKVHIGQ